jgi:hypothetical protein
MTHSLRRLALACVLLAVAAVPAFAQGSSTSTITGTVADSGGGVIPGATVVVTNDAGAKFETVTNAEGVFSVPALDAGNYKVTVSLSGFKTWTSDVRLAPNTPVALKAVLEVGALSETITVATSTELVNTQNATISSTLNADQLNRMPTPTRNALNAVTFLPGVNTAGTNRNSNVNGLPDSMVNITLDGVSNNDNFLRSSDGFFASVTPRQDAVEAVTVTTAVAGANLGGSGAVTINFQTRSGTNRFSGSGYEYFRHPSLNSNYWFNERVGEPKNEVKLNQYGARVGGPIVFPGLFDGRGKAFYFFHYEQLRFPNSFTRTRNVLNPRALDGTFLYDVGDVTREVNVLDLARSRGFGSISNVDPTMMSLLNRINEAMNTTGAIVQTTNPLVQNYVWQSPGRLFEHQPTLKIDYNLTTRHRLSGSTQVIWAERDPDYLNSADSRFPGSPNYRVFRSTRPLHSFTLRSTLSPNLVNEARVGITAAGGSSRFGQPDDPTQSPAAFEDQGGYAINFDANIGLTDWTATSSPSWRSVPTYSFDNSVNWQRGTHSINFGGTFLRSAGWEAAQQTVPSISLGMSTTFDPARTVFNSTNIPGASSAQLADARDLYALLTGRVISIGGQAALDPATNKYVAFGPRTREGGINMYSLFAQDSWRATPTLTLNLGLRWDLQTPFEPMNDTMSVVEFPSVCGISGLGDGGTYSKCAFFSRQNAGVTPQFVQYTSGTAGYSTDWNNIGPSVSMAWRPNVQDGFLRRILGDPEVATVRVGYSESFERQGLSAWTGQFGANPGSTLTLTRNSNTGLVPAGESWPVFLSQRERLYQQSFPETATYPIAIRANRADDLNAFAPDTKVGSARSWTVSFQRAISRDMAVDIRYVGTRGVNQWSELNYNAIDIESNGYFDEFRLAVANLRANNLAGGNRAGSFAYFGPGTGTSPLPIHLAYLNGRTNADSPGAYTGSSWRDDDITENMVFVNPDPTGAAGALDGESDFWENAADAGLARNFFVLNPDVDDANVLDSGAYSDYHALQLELRRRLSKGLSANINYQYALEGGSAFLGFRYGRVMNAGANVRHAIKTQWDWTIPVGRGQRFGTDMNPVMDAILGGWSFNGVGRIQATMVNFGNVRLIGMSASDLQSMYKHYIRPNDDGINTVYMLPEDVILNTRRAFSVDPESATGYGALGAPEGRYIAPANSENCIQLKAGDCAPRTLLIRAPWFTRFDIGVAKKFALQGSANIEFRFDVLNVLDNVNFNTAANPGSGATIFQVTSAYQDPSNTFDPGGRLGQLMIRINW